MSKSILITLILTLLIAGCSSSNNDSEPTPESNSTLIPGPGGREEIVIPDAPEWIEARDVITLENIPQARYIGRLDASGTVSTVFSFALSPDSTILAGLNNTSVILWDMITGEQQFAIGREGAVEIVYSSEGSELYTIDSEGTVRVYDGRNGRFANDFRAITDFSGALDHDSNRDLLAVGNTQGEVKVWDTFERLSLATIQTDVGEIRDLALSADGTTLVVAGRVGAVEIWDWEDRERLTSFDIPPILISQIAISPDNTLLAVGLPDVVNIYTMDSYELRYEFRSGGDDGVANDVLKFSPDGQYLVHGGLMPDMLIWNVETGERVAVLPSVGADRVSAAFSPDSDMLITTVLDGTVSVWDLTSVTDEAIVSAGLDVQTNRIIFVEWSDDGFVMLFFDGVGPIYVWGISATPSD